MPALHSALITVIHIFLKIVDLVSSCTSLSSILSPHGTEEETKILNWVGLFKNAYTDCTMSISNNNLNDLT